MPEIKNQPAMKLHRQPRAFEEQKQNATALGLSDFAKGLGNFASQALMAASPALGALTSGLGTGTLGGLGLGGFGGMLGNDFAQQLALIQLQRQIQMQSQTVEMLSNMSKAEHEQRMSPLRNIRP